MCCFLQRMIHFDMTNRTGFAHHGKMKRASWSLKAWTAELSIHLLQDLYFGDELEKIEPNMPHILAKFDDVSHQAWYGYPSFLTPTRNRLDRHIKSCPKRYFEIPQEHKQSVASFTRGNSAYYRCITAYLGISRRFDGKSMVLRS